MIQIEYISVNEKYSISLWFNKDFTKENVLFGEEGMKQIFFRNKSTQNYEKEYRKSNFGTIIENGLAFAESDNLRIIRTAVDGLASVLKQGKGIHDIEPYKTELFRIYNNTDNIFERYVILKLWHECLVKHKEVNSLLNTMRRKQWEQIGMSYGSFADKMLMPFEKKFIVVDDVMARSGQVRIETLITDKSVESIYTFDEDIMPLYVIYMTELTRRGKHIRTCEICGRYFVASRKDTRVCSGKCKAQRQAEYFQEHKEKVKDDIVDKTYQQNRDGYDNFLKKLNKSNAPADVVNSYKEAKYAFLEEGKRKRKAYRDGKLKKNEMLEWIREDRLKRIGIEQNID